MKQTIEETFENEEDITVEDCIEWLDEEYYRIGLQRIKQEKCDSL